jgi:hypothetical protein
MDVANCVTDAIYRLGFVNAGELTTTSWVTPAELYQFADEAGKRLAREAGAFVTVDNSIAVTAGTAVYSLPENHVFSMQVVLGTQS